MSKKQKTLSFDEFADELLLERQPRALIILAAAHIDIQLRDIIETFLWPKAGKQKDNDEILDGDSPLSTFSSRINMTHRLGLIDHELRRNLHKLRDIRNQAAHWTVFGVQSAPLRDQLRDLCSDIQKGRPYHLTSSKYFGEAKLTEMESLKAVMLTLGARLGSIAAAKRSICPPTVKDS